MTEYSFNNLVALQYQAMLEALNDIKDALNTTYCTMVEDATVDEYRELCQKIEDIAARVSTVDLFNPHNKPGQAEKLVMEMVNGA